MKLFPFGKITMCPKCGGKSVYGRKYVQARMLLGVVLRPEHLVSECVTCGYEIHVACADAVFDGEYTNIIEFELDSPHGP